MDNPRAPTDTAVINPLALTISGDRIRLILTYSGPLPDHDELVEQIAAALPAFPFTIPPSREQWEARVTQAVLLQDLRAVTILEGVPATPPVHGSVEWVTDFFSRGFVTDAATGRVDYRQPAAHRSVVQGQLLGRVLPPRDGVEGIDVLGRKVTVEKARPARFKAGPNVRFDQADGSIYAQATGRIRLKDGLVTVDEVFMVEGSVGLESGNIRHPGALVVRGDIEADAIVETAGTIEVMGSVEPSTIVTDGELIVHGGIAGNKGASIRAGTIRAKFILDATIESGGDVIVETEIVQSQIRARGAVSCVRGRIVGGRVVAQGGIEAAYMGSDSGTRTVLHAGEDLELAAQLAVCDAKLVEWKKQRDRIVTRIVPLREHADRLEPHVREALAKLEEQVAQIAQEMSDVQDEKRRLREASRAHCRPEIYVHLRAYSDCYFALSDERMRLSETMQGPVCLENLGGKVSCRVVQGSQRGSHLLDADPANHTE